MNWARVLCISESWQDSVGESSMRTWADTHYVQQPLSSQVTCEFVDIVRDRYPVLSTASGGYPEFIEPQLQMSLNHHTPCFLHRVLQQQSDVFGGQTFQQNPTDPNSILLVRKCPITIFSSAPQKKVIFIFILLFSSILRGTLSLLWRMSWKGCRRFGVQMT